MNSHEIHHLLDLYGLIAVFLGTGAQALGAPLPGGTVLVAAAIYASTKHGLPVAGVLLSGAGGAFAGTTLAYGLGRWRGERALVRAGRLLRQRPERIQRLRERFRSNAAGVLFVGRFITGARNLVGLLAGASGMPLAGFLVVAAAAALAWSAMITLEYYFFGQTLVGASTGVQVALVLVGIIATIVVLRVAHARIVGPSEPPTEQPEIGSRRTGD